MSIQPRSSRILTAFSRCVVSGACPSLANQNTITSNHGLVRENFSRCIASFARLVVLVQTGSVECDAGCILQQQGWRGENDPEREHRVLRVIRWITGAFRRHRPAGRRLPLLRARVKACREERCPKTHKKFVCHLPPNVGSKDQLECRPNNNRLSSFGTSRVRVHG